jgi:hypothetical protein
MVSWSCVSALAKIVQNGDNHGFFPRLALNLEVLSNWGPSMCSSSFRNLGNLSYMFGRKLISIEGHPSKQRIPSRQTTVTPAAAKTK